MSEHLKFLDSLYFMVITATTIGYGDIIPITRDSRICMSVMIVIIFVIFGDQFSRIMSIIRESDKYDINYKLKDHVVVFNNKSTTVLTSFLLDYLSYTEAKKTSFYKNLWKYLKTFLIMGDVAKEHNVSIFLE